MTKFKPGMLVEYLPSSARERIMLIVSIGQRPYTPICERYTYVDVVTLKSGWFDVSSEIEKASSELEGT